MKFQIELDYFLTYLTVDRGLSLNTKENYERDLKGYLSFMEKHCIQRVDGIEREDIQLYLIQLYEQGLNTKSVARHLSAIRTFHEYLMIEKMSLLNLLLQMFCVQYYSSLSPPMS